VSFRNSLIEFFDQENMGLDTKITLLWQLKPEILMKVRLGGDTVLTCCKNSASIAA